MKRNFTVSAANDECVQAIGDFWKDFNAAHFATDNDRLVLVTLRGTNTLLEHFVGLLDCSRITPASLWAANRAIALRCVNAIATEAALIGKTWEAEENRRYDERCDLSEIITEARSPVRASFWQDGAIAEDAHSTIDTTERFGADATTRMLIILGRIPQDPLAIAAFARASKTLVSWWKSDDDRDHRRDRNFHTESDVSQRLQEFLLRTTPEAAREVLAPVLGAIDRHSRELQAIMQGLTGIQDSSPNTPQYWLLWSLFADAVKRAKMGSAPRRRASGR